MAVRSETLGKRAGFRPNDQQRDAILHTKVPLFLTAGSGSGKTRVPYWRTLNLIVFHDVPPEESFLGTFREKAALQLRHDLTGLLSDATQLTGQPYDLSRMPLGTVTTPRSGHGAGCNSRAATRVRHANSRAFPRI